MIIFIRKCHLKQLEKIMSNFLNDFRAILDKVATHAEEDAETKQALADLQAKLETNEANDEELKTAILELTQKLAKAEPLPPEA